MNANTKSVIGLSLRSILSIRVFSSSGLFVVDSGSHPQERPATDNRTNQRSVLNPSNCINSARLISASGTRAPSFGSPFGMGLTAFIAASTSQRRSDLV